MATWQHGSCWRHLREKITKPMHRKSARRATRQSIEIFRVVIHVFRGADKVETKIPPLTSYGMADRNDELLF